MTELLANELTRLNSDASSLTAENSEDIVHQSPVICDIFLFQYLSASYRMHTCTFVFLFLSFPVFSFIFRVVAGLMQ